MLEVSLLVWILMWQITSVLKRFFLLFSFVAHPTEHKKRVPALDAVVTPDDIRYFTSETDDISNLEASVQENPCDVQLWIKLAYKYLNQNEG